MQEALQGLKSSCSENVIIHLVFWPWTGLRHYELQTVELLIQDPLRVHNESRSTISLQATDGGDVHGIVGRVAVLPTTAAPY